MAADRIVYTPKLQEEVPEDLLPGASNPKGVDPEWIPCTTPMEPLSDEKITELARDIVTNRVFCTNDEHAVKCAFYMVLMFVKPSQMPPNVGAFYAPYGESVPGRAMNGYPIFYSIGFVPKESLPALTAKIDELYAALGIDRDKPPEPPMSHTVTDENWVDPESVPHEETVPHEEEG